MPEKDELVECLTTGRFDAKNKRVRQIHIITYNLFLVK